MPIISLELSSFLQNYLDESLKFESNKLPPLYTVWGELKKPKNNLIVCIVEYENRWKEKFKQLIYSTDKKKQQAKIEELKLLVSEIDKAEQRFSNIAAITQSMSFIISFLSVFFTVLVKLIMGDNNISMQIVVLFILFIFTLYIFSNAWHYMRLASNTKCLGKTAKEVLDCFSTNNSILNDP